MALNRTDLAARLSRQRAAGPAAASDQHATQPARHDRPPVTRKITRRSELSASTVFSALADRLPAEATVLEETPSTRSLLNALLPVRAPLGRLSAAGGGLGFAMPAAVGLRLALPERPVICVIGDWSSLYSVHALWSAAHYHAGVLFVALRNGGYRILDHLSAEAAPGATPAWPAIEPLDIATIAEGFGCPSARATTTGELLDHLNRVVPTLRTAATPLLLQVDVPDEPSDRP